MSDWQQILYAVQRIAIAYVLALPIGWERERETRGIGLRTFPLVAMASCGYVMLGEHWGQDSAEVTSRILQGLVAGIGFIGGGAILKNPEAVRGTATAASIWNTGVIGAATATGKWEIAVVVSVMNLITLRLLVPLKAMLNQDRREERRPEPPQAG
jgi:putative Mg2+ transporter-C (MgtC) family protein